MQMGWRSLRENVEVSGIRAQLKGARKIEQYRVTDQGVFLPKKQYIPVDTIEKIQSRKGQMNTANCCGMSFPVYNVVIFYGGERPIKLMFEKQENSEKFAQLLLSLREDIYEEEYIPPYQKHSKRN